MLKKILAIIALVAILLLTVDVFLLHYALEFALPLYIILTLVGLIFLVFSKTHQATNRVREAMDQDTSPEDTEFTEVIDEQ